MRKALCALLLLLLILAAGVSALGQGSRNAASGDTQTPVEDVPQTLGDAVEALVREGRAKGAVLSVVRDGSVVLCAGYGMADEANGIAADARKTAFRIGSISKTFVAVAAQLLAQQGKLDMDRDITAYLEADFPALDHPVTMGQLLTHTAGFEDRVTGIAVANVSDTEPLALSVRKYKPAQVFLPGEVASYSNYGIALAAYVVQRIAGQDFAAFCRASIFVPLEMAHTTFEHMHDIAYVSKAYLPDGSETREPYMNLYPEGSAVSTAEDMAGYIAWLLDGNDPRVLSAASKEALFARHFSMAGDMAGVGYTWNRKERNGNLYYDKKGETLHFYSRIALYPQAGTGVFLSFNTYVPEEEINAVMGVATDLLYGASSKAAAGQGATDISGCYANNWSSLRTPERILRYLIPGKILSVEGSPEEGFAMNGQPMAGIAGDKYASPIGVVRFVHKNGAVMLATESAVTFSRIPWWQHSGWQALPALLFVVMAIACLVREVFLRARRRKEARHSAVVFVGALAQLLAFAALCVLMIHGITAYSLLSLALPMALCGWLIASATAAGMLHMAYRWAKGVRPAPIPVAWNLAGALLCLWMVSMNLL